MPHKLYTDVFCERIGGSSGVGAEALIVSWRASVRCWGVISTVATSCSAGTRLIARRDVQGRDAGAGLWPARPDGADMMALSASRTSGEVGPVAGAGQVAALDQAVFRLPREGGAAAHRLTEPSHFVVGAISRSPVEAPIHLDPAASPGRRSSSAR